MTHFCVKCRTYLMKKYKWKLAFFYLCRADFCGAYSPLKLPADFCKHTCTCLHLMFLSKMYGTVCNCSIILLCIDQLHLCCQCNSCGCLRVHCHHSPNQHSIYLASSPRGDMLRLVCGLHASASSQLLCWFIFL